VLRRRATVEHSSVADATQSKNTSSIPALRGRAKFMPTLRVENYLTAARCPGLLHFATLTFYD